MTPPEVTPEHQWLQQLVGEWTMEGQAEAGPDGQPCTSMGTEVVRALGEVWIVCEGEGSMPDGAPAKMRMTLGYDPATQKFIGNWVGPMMTNMWVYEGELDAERRVLSLYTQGPGFEEGTIGKYKDVIELKSPDHRVMTSHAQQEDGTWSQFMQADYRRVQQ